MFLKLKKRTVTASAIAALTVSLGAAAMIGQAHAGSKPSEAYFVKVDRSTTTSSKPGKPARAARIKRAPGTVCCSLPRRGKPAFLKPARCKQAKGRIIPQRKCGIAARKAETGFQDIITGAGTGGNSKPHGN